MKYYVIYATKDIGWYKTTSWVLGMTTNKNVAEDFCKKFDCNYTVEETGEERITPLRIKLLPEKEEK